MTAKNLSLDALSLIAGRFKLLSEPIRLQILHKLQEGETSVNELTEAVSTSQPNVSKHLKMLQAEGILRREQRGNTVYYSIADDSIFTLCELVCDSLESRLKTQAEIFGG
ncbi:MAG: winged helix-turn-helix transcriptional regulator [Pyrinomonadaceae bacterium]|nr:winged helix-turn-helix transcriptional regulator [Pyrinomonadaceae bacterium]